ncbi:MAG: hypothetical protein ACPLRW_09490 [Moorellales bacterium]
MILVDGSVLRLAEVWRDNFLLEYRYYWLKPTRRLPVVTCLRRWRVPEQTLRALGRC